MEACVGIDKERIAGSEIHVGKADLNAGLLRDPRADFLDERVAALSDYQQHCRGKRHHLCVSRIKPGGRS